MLFRSYVKTYLVPTFSNMYKTFKSLSLDQSDYAGYYTCTQDSFFDKVDANIVFNDFIDDMEMGFTTNPDKIYSFSDELNNLVSDGNLFRGTYEGAYVTYLNNAGIPIAYFGAGNNNIFTVAHEFGHFMNEIYNESQYDQSYDLLEVHSQGHESLLLAYIEQEKLFSGSVLKAASTEQMLNNLFIIVCALQVDTFEQAIYLDYYDGYGSEEIMADGTITYDEYQTLYEYIAEDFGIAEEYQNNEYWRHGMTITSPCYYVSYSVSAVNALQIYMMASTDGLDTAKDSYLKLITYTDVDPSYDMNQVLEYAGLASYMDEELYKDLAEFFATK